jgi:Tfp pilus assembly protein PilF
VDESPNFFARGNEDLQSGKVPEAVKSFERAVKADPGFPEAHYNLALAYQRNGDEVKSTAEFKKYKSLLDQH